MPNESITLPDDFINRKAERDLFDRLLELQDDARLLAIADKQGTGKSTLLELLEHNCKYITEFPVSRVLLEEPTINSSITFIEGVRRGFGKDLTFPVFDPLNDARLGKRGSVFSPQAPVFSGKVDARKAIVNGEKTEVTGGKFYNYGTVNVSGPAWDDEMAELAKERCISTFFDDLKAIANQNTVVVLLDSYERSNVDLRPWIRDDFLRPLCFKKETRPKSLILGLAGTEVPNFESILGPEKNAQLVRSRSLSGWEKGHVKDFLRVHGFDNLSDTDVDKVWEKVELGFSIRAAIKLARGLRGDYD